MSDVKPVAWMPDAVFEALVLKALVNACVSVVKLIPEDVPLYNKAAVDALQAEIEALRKDAERHESALEKLRQWAQAYPLEVFPEPDFKKAHEVLKANGMTLDAISAFNMRHVITKVVEIVDAAIAKEKQQESLK